MGRPKKTAPEPAEGAAPQGIALPRAVDWQNPRVVQILDAASRCFGKNGFAATTVQDIADEAGLTKSMIHYYFENKQALIQELQAFVYERHFRKVEQKLADVGPSAKGRAFEALQQSYEIVHDRHFLRLQIELLSEAGRDPEVMKRLAVLDARSREVVGKGVLAVLDDEKRAAMPVSVSALSTLIAAVLHGLRVFEYVEGAAAPTDEAYGIFVGLMLLGLQQVESGGASRRSKKP